MYTAYNRSMHDRKMPNPDFPEQKAPGYKMHGYAVFTACCTFLLLIAGALVTSNDAGLSIPDWPLAYGSLHPPMVGGIRYEFSHRVIASCVGLLTVRLALG